MLEMYLKVLKTQGLNCKKIQISNINLIFYSKYCSKPQDADYHFQTQYFHSTSTEVMEVIKLIKLFWVDDKEEIVFQEVLSLSW